MCSTCLTSMKNVTKNFVTDLISFETSNESKSNIFETSQPSAEPKPKVCARKTEQVNDERFSNLELKEFSTQTAVEAFEEIKKLRKLTTTKCVINSCGFISNAVMTVENQKYEGYGNSKDSAKENLHENILHSMVLLAQNDQKLHEIPIMTLASYALHKLLSEWNPKTSQNYTATENLREFVKIHKKLPRGCETFEPIQLLTYIRPDVVPTFKSTVKAWYQKHQAEYVLDGRRFSEISDKKKTAHKKVAINILKTLYQWEPR